MRTINLCKLHFQSFYFTQSSSLVPTIHVRETETFSILPYFHLSYIFYILICFTISTKIITRVVSGGESYILNHDTQLFFFFFWEAKLNGSYLLTRKSISTKRETYVGTSSIQTTKEKEILTLWPKAWTTALLCLLTWVKKWVCNKPKIDITSFSMCHILARE